MADLIKNLLLLLLLIVLSSVMLTGCGQRSSEYVGFSEEEKSCITYEAVESGILFGCPGEQVLIKNGSNGVNGTHGKDAKEPLFVMVCDDGISDYQETLVKVGDIYLAFYSGRGDSKKRLAQLKENTLYTTTDGRSQRFSIVEGSIVCL